MWAGPARLWKEAKFVPGKASRKGPVGLTSGAMGGSGDVGLDW